MATGENELPLERSPPWRERHEAHPDLEGDAAPLGDDGHRSIRS
jgi:hypothetical protein